MYYKIIFKFCAFEILLQSYHNLLSKNNRNNNKAIYCAVYIYYKV